MTGREGFDWVRLGFGFFLWAAIVSLLSFFFLKDNAPIVISKLLTRTPIATLLVTWISVLITLAFTQILVAYLVQGFSILFKNKIITLLILFMLPFVGEFAEWEYSDHKLATLTSAFGLTTIMALSIALDDGMEIACGLAAAEMFLSKTLGLAGSLGISVNLADIINFLYLRQYSTIEVLIPHAFAFATLAIVYKWRPNSLFAKIGRKSNTANSQGSLDSDIAAAR